MAIRKFRKKLKPFIWTITIAFLLSLGAGFFTELSRGFKGTKSYAFKLNDKKIDKLEVERAKSRLSNMYSQNLGAQIDEDIAEVIGIDDTITINLVLEIAKKLKINVSNSDVEKEYKNIEQSIPDKDQFKKTLIAQGLTKATLKKGIKQNLIINTTMEYFKNSIIPKEDEIEAYYKENKDTKFLNKDIKDSKEEIITEIKNSQGMENFEFAMNDMKKNMKILDVQEEYKESVPKMYLIKDGFSVSNSDYFRRVVGVLFQKKGDRENANKLATEQLNVDIKIAKIAMDKEIKVDDRFPLEKKLFFYKSQLFDAIKKEVKVSEKGIKELFEKTKKTYNIDESLSANIAIVDISPSEKDKIENSEKAEKLLKTLTKENFEENAKKYSKDLGSASKGGELGWFRKGDFIPAFENAVFEGVVGEIYPKVVSSEIGEHLIYVKDKRTLEGKEEVNASHILLKATPSKESENIVKEKAEDILKKLNSKELTFANLIEKEKAVSFSRNLSNITKNGYINEIGKEEDLVKNLFASDLNKIIISETENKIFIAEKVSEKPFVEAKLSDSIIYEKVKEEYVTTAAYKEIEELIKK
ncbi:MAG: peptidylprolyl isomerase [Fusobacteriaceae bacterium]